VWLSPLVWRRVGLFRSPAAQVGLACGTIGVVFLAILVAPFPVWGGHPTGPPLTGGPPLEAAGWVAVPVAIGFALTLCLPYRPYSLALRTLVGALVTTRLLVVLTAVLAGVSLLIYPRFGSDIFDYAGFERLWVVYGDNPLLSLVANRPTDWAAAFVWYPDRTPAYGPLWAVVTWPIVRLAGESAAAEVLGYKLLSALAYGACCWLIWTGVEPARRQRALVVFAWSPLVLFEVLGKVHNDVFPALSLLAMVWLIGRGRGLGGMLAVVAGALVKPTALAAAPLLGLHLWRKGGWRALVPAVVGGLVLAGVSYAPFWEGPRTVMAVWQQTSRLGWSPATLLIVGSAWLFGAQFDGAVRVVLGLVWAGVCGVVLVRRRAELAESSGWLLLATVLLLTSAIFAHYFVPAVALAAVANRPRLERAVYWLSIGGLAAYGLEILGMAFDPQWIGSSGYQVVGTLVLLAPASVILAEPHRFARSLTIFKKTERN
jgi:hypothetical protein